MLIYANGTEYETLAQEDNISPVTSETPYVALETMDAKWGHRYPVYLINDAYGGRGLNFRAASSSHGITMLILGTFPDRTTRHQALMRVGRFGDKCCRI